MKKTFQRISAFLLAVISAFIIYPFNSVYASSFPEKSWNNLVDWYRTAVGMLRIDNGAVSGLSRDDFYESIYHNSLIWRQSDGENNITFIPADKFTLSDWKDCCNGTLRQDHSDYNDFFNFDIGQCLIDSDYINDTGSGYKVGTAPTLSNSTNGEYPLDGVEVITNFGDFSNGFTNNFVAQNYFNQLKANCANNADNYTIISGELSSSRNVLFFAYSDVDFVYFLKRNDSIYMFGYLYNNSWSQSSRIYTNEIVSNNSSGSTVNIFYPTDNNPVWLYSGNNLSFSDSSVYYSNKSSVSTVNPLFYSTVPVVIASTQSNAKNYYYWKNGSPSGGFFSTSNNNNVYSYDVINNNNWNNAYNNYITDVSNYYSTTSNITNEQITQYIDQSTTINNITNNYITNVVNPDNPDNPDNPSGGDVITNSWLERIYEKLEYIIDILLGRQDSETDTTIYTDNSIKNDVVYYPFSDLFPDVPESDFLPELTTLDIPLISSKMNNVLSRAMPFCYMWQLGTVAEALSAPPRAPTYDIPFKIERLNIDEEVSIDLSSNSWSVLHSIWITLFMITFLVALFYMTYRFIMLINALF